MIAAYIEDPASGQFVGNCLGEFPSVENAALTFRKDERPIFVEDCIFGNSAGIPRYAVTWSHGVGTPEYINLTPANSLANPQNPPSTNPTNTIANPLTAIIGYTQLAQAKLKNQTELSHYLQQILLCVNEAANLVRQFHIVRLDMNSDRGPQLIGPFNSEDERNDHAKEIRKENEDHLIFALNGPGTSIELFSYSADVLQNDNGQFQSQ